MKKYNLFMFMLLSLISSSASSNPLGSVQALLQANAACYPLSSNWTPKYANLVAYWRLTGTLGAVANGQSVPATVGPNGTTVNANGTGLAYVKGKELDQALSFDGTDYVNMGDNSTFNLTVPYTIAAWVYMTSTVNVQPFVASDVTTNYVGYSFRTGSNGKLSMRLGDNTGQGTSNRRTGIGSTTLSTNRWYHAVVVVRSGTDMSIYLNKVPETVTYSGTGGTTVYTSAPFNIAQDDAGRFTGVIDEVALWSVELTEAEIIKIYDSQSCGKN